MKRMFYEMDCRRILDLMAIVEDRTGKMFHEYDAELEKECRKALDGEIHASFLINKLCKLVDSIDEGVK